MINPEYADSFEELKREQEFKERGEWLNLLRSYKKNKDYFK